MREKHNGQANTAELNDKINKQAEPEMIKKKHRSDL